MKSYLILLRGVNVGGKNKVPMADLKQALMQDGVLSDVSTYIQSGNIILKSTLKPKQLSDKVEAILAENFTLDSAHVKALAIAHDHLSWLVRDAPADFGANYEEYRYDAIFAMDITVKDLMEQLVVRDGIDRAWAGKLAVYFRRPSLKSKNATKSYLGKISQKPAYESLTIRSWQTVTKLLDLMEDL